MSAGTGEAGHFVGEVLTSTCTTDSGDNLGKI
jgi:hypothetical protein